MLWSSLLLSFWVALMVFLISWLGGQIVWLFWHILQAIPIVRCLGRLILAFVFFPGVVLHELCHAVILTLAGFKVVKIWLFPKITETEFELGSTVPGNGGDTMFAGYIYAAPLLLGSAVVTLLLRYGFHIPWPLLLRPPEEVLSAFVDVARSILSRRSWLMIYLLFALGNGAMPGYTDWQGLCQFLIATFLTLVIASFSIVTVAFKVLSDPTYVKWWLSLLSMLAIQFTIVAVIDVPVYLVLFFPGSAAQQLRRSRLETSS